MCWLCRKTASDTWEVGYFAEDCQWVTIKTYTLQDHAFAMVSYLNGGLHPDKPVDVRGPND